jgi:hypothetical protein
MAHQLRTTPAKVGGMGNLSERWTHSSNAASLLIHSQEKRTSKLLHCQCLNIPGKPSQLLGIPDVSTEKYKAGWLQVEYVNGKSRIHFLSYEANHQQFTKAFT